MKHLKRITIAIIALASLTSCTKEVPAELNVTTTELTFAKDGGSQSISFSTNKEWTASSSAAWAKVTSSGSSSATSISVNVDANPDYDDRTATITIKAESLSKTVTIKQSTNTGFIVSKKDFDITNDAQSIEVEVQANVEFEVSIDEACKGWISKAETKGLTSNKVFFNIAKNESYDNREGKIEVKQKSGAQSETITIKQGQTNGLFITKSDYAVSNSEHDITVEVKSNVEFEVSSEADWITYVETKALKTSNISLKVAENGTYDKRTGKVKVKQTNGSLSGVITIVQDEGLGLIVTPESFELDSEEHTVSVEVQSNVEYDIIIPEEAKGWISIAPATKGLTSESISFNVAKNESIEDKREASVTFKQKDGELCGTVKFTQSPKVSADIKITSFNVGVIGGIISLEISHNVEITGVSIEDSAKSWIQQAETKGIQTDVLNFDVKENETDKDRTGKITISFGSTSKEISVTQLGDGIIEFSNSIIKYACVHKYDTNGDGELSRKEAALVTDLSDLFSETGVPKTEFSFNEMKFFTSATKIPSFGSSNLTEIIIPNGVSIIPRSTFIGCNKLNKVVFDGTFRSLVIESFAFGCELIRKFNLPEGLTSIEEGAFSGCDEVEFNLPSTIESIGDGVFSSDKFTFHSVVFPSSLVNIGKKAFAGANLTGTTTFKTQDITIPEEAFKQAHFDDIVFETNSVKEIGNSAFEEAHINSVIIKNQNKLNIKTKAFYKSTLEEISFYESSVNSIWESAFGQTNLRSVTIPSMEKLDRAFENDIYLEDVIFTGSIDYLYGTFRGCTALKSIKIPDWMTEIPEYLFEGCNSLTDVDFSKSTTKVKQGAFKDCPFYKKGVSSFTIPPQIESIESGFLFNLVQNIIIEKEDGIFDLNVFAQKGLDQAKKYTSYYVPSELVEIYRNRFSAKGYKIYDIKEFPIYKPYESIPEGFVDMGLPVLWAREDYDNGNEYSWPGTSLDHDNYRVPTADDLNMLKTFCVVNIDHYQKTSTIVSPYTHQSITIAWNRWLSDEGWSLGWATTDGGAIGINSNNGEFGVIRQPKTTRLPIRMVYSEYNK